MQLLRLEAQPQKYRAPSRKEGNFTGQSSSRGLGRIEAKKAAGQGTAPRPKRV